MLAPYRVLDLADERGLLCGHVLAGLGADVILVEPPGGSSARHAPPLLPPDAAPEGERSLYWAAYARNRRSVALDLDDPDGRAALLRLAARPVSWQSSSQGARKWRALSTWAWSR